MPTRTDHGYSVKRSNEVLRGVSIYSGASRARSSTDYHVVQVGMKVGAKIEWLATWDQRTQAMNEGEPIALLPAARQNMRLPQDCVIVTRLTTQGFPASIDGSSVDLDLTLTGGRTGDRRALISVGSNVGDARTREALQGMSGAVNTSGMAEKVARIPLEDVRAVADGTFQGRLQRDSATQISLQRYSGNWIEVDGDLVGLTSTGLLCTSTDGLLGASGGVTSIAPAVSTLYYVYVGEDQLRLCPVAPTAHRGAYYLGTDASTRRWRFVGWVYTDSSTQFVDSDTQRLVINYYNRRPLRLFTCPGYADDLIATTYPEISAVWAKVNAGVGADLQWIGNGEDVAWCEAQGQFEHSVPGTVSGFGISYDAAASPTVVWEYPSPAVGFVSSLAHPPVAAAVGLHTFSLLARTAAITMTIIADEARNGATADPYVTYMVAWVMG